MGASGLMADAGWASDTLVVSHDVQMAGRLQGVLEREHRRRVTIAQSFTEAESVFERTRFDTVFIDFRRTSVADDPSSLLHRIGHKRKRRTPVIAISNGGYVCDWAVLADLIVAGHLELPLDRQQVARLLDHEIAHSVFNAADAQLAPRTLKSRSVTFKTYSPQMFQLLDEVATMAKHDVTVLLVGETGTGKTTLARLLHELSPRVHSRFLTVACGSLPPDLIESEMFGHVKGAFTSADHTKEGKFAATREGSLLLDEIDVLELGSQAKLLRVIETGEFEPVGSNETQRSLARLIVASNEDLEQLAADNQFRADLYYRLNSLVCRIPPLRDRINDIVPLTLDFVDEFCRGHKVHISRVHPDFLACLKTYSWPGNIRELKNYVRRAVLFCRSDVLTPDDLAPHFREPVERTCLLSTTEATIPGDSPPSPAASRAPVSQATGLTLGERVAMNERDLLIEALVKNDYSRNDTSRQLGISRVGLYKKMKKHGLLPKRGKKG